MAFRMFMSTGTGWKWDTTHPHIWDVLPYSSASEPDHHQREKTARHPGQAAERGRADP